MQVTWLIYLPNLQWHILNSNFAFKFKNVTPRNLDVILDKMKVKVSFNVFIALTLFLN